MTSILEQSCHVACRRYVECVSAVAERKTCQKISVQRVKKMRNERNMRTQ